MWRVTWGMTLATWWFHRYSWVTPHLWWIIHRSCHMRRDSTQRHYGKETVSNVIDMNESCHACGWVMWRVTRGMTHHRETSRKATIESSHTYQWVKSHVSMSHVIRINESSHIYQWVKSHVSMSQVTRMHESCHTYQRVMSHVSMSHVTRINESCDVSHEKWLTTETSRKVSNVNCPRSRNASISSPPPSTPCSPAALCVCVREKARERERSRFCW